MGIHFACSHCGEVHTVRDELAGKLARCKSCKQEVRVPQLGPQIEENESGQQLMRYDARKEGEIVFEGTPYHEELYAHFEKHMGPISSVFHEIISHTIHLDVMIIPPTGLDPSDKHPLGTHHYTLVTSGMSSLPMAVPESESIPDRAELAIILPGGWNPAEISQHVSETVESERSYWPIRWLKTLARFPHEYSTFLGPGHTIPNGEDCEPYADNTRLGCMMVDYSAYFSDRACHMKASDGTEIAVYSLWPLYPAEVNLKLKNGSDALRGKFAKYNITDMIVPRRRNVCKWW